MRTFKLRVRPADRTAQLVSKTRMWIRFAALLLLLLLVLGLFKGR